MTNKDKPFKNILILGCGDIGRRVAKIWRQTNLPIYGVVRSHASETVLKHLNIMSIQADLDDKTRIDSLPVKASLLYYFAPPPGKGQEDTRMFNFLTAISETQLPQKIVYISTSGVYGDQAGKLINEETAANPQIDRARRRYHAEQQLQHWSNLNAVPLVILRVGGIYGPGRLPLKRIKDRIPMVYENLAPQTNRIHADDLAQVCYLAATRTSGQAVHIYNVSDGSNSNMTEYFNTIADYFKLERPPLVNWEEANKVISPGMLSYLKESRKMDNSKMLAELGVKLRYPNLKEGIKNCNGELE